MSMSFWVIVSWVAVLLLTGINVFLVLKLKSASEQMMKMAFPNAKNMGEAMAQMQGMMGQMGAMRGRAGAGGRGGFPGVGGPRGGGQNMDAQLKAAMDMLANMQKGKR